MDIMDKVSMSLGIIQWCKYSREVNHLEAQLIYPKIIIIENKCTIRIFLKAGMKDFEEMCVHEMDCEIVNKLITDNFLWTIHKSGETFLIKLEDGSRHKVSFDNYFGSKPRDIRCDGKEVVLINESGESFLVSYPAKHINQIKSDDHGQEFVVCLKRIVTNQSTQEMCMSTIFYNGLHIFLESGTLMLNCPISGIYKASTSVMKFQHVVPWEEFIVLAKESAMYIVDIKKSSIWFEFEKIYGSYYPLGVYNMMFYYIAWNNGEVCIYSASNSCVEQWNNSEENNCLNSSTTKFSSQEHLKLQLKKLIQQATAPECKLSEVIAHIQGLFGKITDYSFLIDSALELCQHSIAYKLILYPLQMQIHAVGDTQMINILSDVIIKVDLLEYINFRGNNYYKDINLFNKNFKQLCTTFITRSDLDLAAICWLKYSEIKISIDQNDITDILNSIPHNIKLGALIIWLKKIIPSLLDENPFIIDLFVKWTMKRVFELEKSGYWPKIGLKFIDEIINVLETSLKTVSIRPISMDDLDTLKDHINYIIELKEKYKINMLLAELSSQSPNEVALIMLRRCYTEDLELFLHDYLPAYAARHLFDLDDTLRLFIENEAASSGGGVDGFRLKLLLDSLRSITIKLDCLLQVLKVLDVPWSPAVLDQAISAAASAAKDFTASDADRTLALEIQNELNYANVKVVLKKYNFPLSCTDYMLVLLKIVNAPCVDLNDLQVITSSMTNYNNYGHVLYIVRCLQDCETNVALDYFYNLSNNQKKKILKVITCKYELIINNDDSNIVTERNYLDFLKGTKLLNEIQIVAIENLYHLKNSYSISLNLNKLYNEDYCVKETTLCIAKDGYIASSGRGGCVSKLTHRDVSRNSKLMALLRRTSTSNPIRKLIEKFIACFTLESSSSSDKESALCVFKDGDNSKLLLDSSSVLVALIVGCAEEHIHYLMNNLSALHALQNANLILKNLSVVWKFHYIFLPMSSFAGINDLVNFYENLNQSNNDASTFYSEGCDFIPFTIISSLMGKAMTSEYLLSEDFFKTRNKVAKKLLHKVAGSQDLDEVLLTALLLILNKYGSQESSSWILEILQGQNESLPPVIMAYLTSPIIRRTFGLDTNLPGNKVSYPPQYILRSKFNMNLPEIALTDCSEETWDGKVILFYVLRQNPEMTFERLVDSCRTLNVSLNDGSSLQLIALLTTWELKYKIFNDNLNCRQINFENDHKEIIAKCSVIWENINNKDFIKDILNDFWKNGEVTLHGRLVSINPYYYEVYLCIYRLIFGSSIELRNKKEYFLLNFLKAYRRNSTPRQYEYELFSVKGMFPEIGYYRLPFQLFMREDMWSNLKSEITLETYERWLPVVALLSLDPDLQTARDMICSNALKQTMTNRKRTDNVELDSIKENEPWKLTSCEEPLLRAAHRCVRHIANMEWAGACLFYVLQGCARGADQVAAAQLCYQFAHRWAELQPGNRAIRQMKRLHLTLSTRHALHKIDWACEEFLRLSTEPAQLIRALYLHPNFVGKMSRHDVNRAVNEIAEKNAVNISSIRIQILENILEKSQEEKTMSFLGLDTKELMTAKYILKATCPKMGAIYLSRIAFDDESDFNKCKKLRALQCLMSVVDPDTAVKVTNKERGALWISLLELIYVVNLEHIDMPWIVATFVQNKISALDQLLQSANTNIDALKIAAELARRYGNTQIIWKLIPLMLRAGLHEEMIPLLLKISSPPNDLLYAAWRAVILSPFQRADYPITEKQRLKCLNAVNLLPVCPVIKDEDLKEIWKHCVRCKCFGIGCLTLPYMTSEARKSLVELKKIDRRNLIASLKNLHTETYLVSGAMFVLENMSIKTYKSK